MGAGVWELILFLWSHPIMSCVVVVLCSPPFFPIIVYFSPLLVCTGLVAVAMISMKMGERGADSEDWRNGTRGRLHEQAVRHNVEIPVKPPRESWLEWMKKKEEKAKAWVDNRFVNHNKWQVRNRSGLEEEESMAVDNYSDEGYPVWSHGELSHPTPVRHTPVRITPVRPTPIATSRGISPPPSDREVVPPTDVANASNDRSYSSVPEAEDIKPARVQVPMEDPPFEFPNLEHHSEPSLVMPLAAAAAYKILKGEIVVPSPAKEEEAVPAAEKKILSAPKAESRVEEPSGSISFESRATEVPAVVLQEEVLFPPVGINENGLSEAPREDEGPRGSDQITKAQALLVGNGAVTGDPGIPVSLEADQITVVDEARNVQTGSDSPGSRLRAVDVLVSPKLNPSGEDRRASPEAEAETAVFSPPNQPDIVQPPERFIATEKIIRVDEPSKFTTLQSRSMVAEAVEIETPPIEKPIGQGVVLETEPHESGSKSPKGRSGDGLDENIESCGNVPPTTSTASAVVLQNSKPMALVRRSVSEGSLPNDLELLAENMEPTMSSIYNDTALTTFGAVLDKSYSLNTTLTGGEDYEDLMTRFYALKKSMSLHTSRRWQEPISLTTADVTNAVVPVYVPDMVTRVEGDPLAESLVFPEKRKARPQRRSENVESIESITARLLTKFTPNLAGNTISTRPPSRPVPAVPTIAPASAESDKSPAISLAASAESDKSAAIAPASVESDESLEIAPVAVESENSAEATENLAPPDDAAAVKSNSHSKRLLASFLSRRRERSMSSLLMEAFSNSGEGGKGTKMSSGTEDTVTSEEGSIAAEDIDEGATTTTSGRQRKERMISPLKRVFSMDSNPGCSRKVDSLKVTSVNSSPATEKQSVMDRSKGKFKKLFHSEGGVTKLEKAEVGKSTVLDAKSESTSKTEEQNVAVGDELSDVVQDDTSLPTTSKVSSTSDAHGTEDVDMDSGKQLLPGKEAASLVEPEEELINKCERLLPSTAPEETMPPPTLDTGEPDDSTKAKANKMTKSSSEKKFSWSWTKKKRYSDPQDALVDPLKSSDRSVSLSENDIDEESRVIVMSPLTHFHSSSAIMSPVKENADACGDDLSDENHSSELRFSKPDSSLDHPDSLKADPSPCKKSSASWWPSKTDRATAESVEKAARPKEKKLSTSWWTRRHTRADSKAVTSSSRDLPPTDTSGNNNITDDIEKSGPLFPSSIANNGRDNSFVELLKKDILPDDDGTAAVARRPWHRRERSDSLPARSKFSRLRGRQTSLSDFPLPRTPVLSPVTSSARAVDYNSSNIGTSSTSFSMSRTDEDPHHHHEHVTEKRNSDPSGIRNSNIRWSTNSSTTTPIKPSSVRTLDFTNELRGSPFHRSELDVNSSLFRGSPSGAEIRITDKLKVPLEEVLSLLSTGDSDELHLTTAENKNTGGAEAGDHRRASSSSSSEEKTSSEEEWSATSEDEDESLQQQQQQPLPQAGRIRRRLPHYIFSRGETTAN